MQVMNVKRYCWHCGKEFRPNGPGAIACGPHCRDVIATQHRPYGAYCCSCGKYISVNPNGEPRITCSNKCRQRFYRVGKHLSAQAKPTTSEYRPFQS